jgi:hypothetical protein
MKVKLVYDGYTGKEVLVDFTVVPRVGERLMMKAGETVEALQVVHTPTNGEHDAVVVVKAIDER